MTNGNLTPRKQAAIRALILATGDEFREAVTERKQKMVTLKDVKTSSFEIGLTKLIGKKVKDVHGYISLKFGEPVFGLTYIELEDGSKLGCEGEHDFPYLVQFAKWEQPNFDEDTLRRIYDEEDEEDE
jgi:hypothetical protein